MLYFPVYKIFVGMNVASTIRFIAGQERPATLILTVISADCVLRVRAMFITGTLKPEIEILFCN